ncbi:MAG: efflux RND transporter permease subunit [Oligoflexales bacterium]
MKQLIAYFARRNLLINVILIGFISSAIFLWPKVGKEEMPEFETNWLRINVRFPGAVAEDVELFVTKQIEKRLKGISGLQQIRSTSAFGSSSFSISFDQNVEDTKELIQTIKDAVERTSLPSEVEEPIYSRFTSSEKAILDIAIYHKDFHLLDLESRTTLQRYALAFEQRILALPEISGSNQQGYLRPEIRILINPDKLKKFNLSLTEVRSQIQTQNVRMPVGSMSDTDETEISITSELDSIDALENLVVRGSFAGKKIRLRQIATIKNAFAKSNTIRKAHGHEAIIYNIKKNASTDIISAQEAAMKFIEKFKKEHANAPIGIVTADDESYDVRNRLSLIGSNGLIGFILIIIVLFIFLDLKSGIWVAMGIPFTLAFTLIGSVVLGYSVNNMTLAAIIIVLGIVVDDAIIVAENIARYREKGMNTFEAVVEGTRNVILPVTASILTTCAAFLPLFFFSGWYGLLVKYIPPIIFLMLFASLIESGFILPGHLNAPLTIKKNKSEIKRVSKFAKIEDIYSNILAFILRGKYPVILAFIGLMFGAIQLFQKEFKFVMFPREETKEISIRATGPDDLNRFEMAKLVQALEEIFIKDKSVVKAVLTRIGQNRRGGAVKENKASIRVEILPPSERSIPLSALMKKWQTQADKLQGFKNIKFMKSRWGSASGSPIEIEIRENDDHQRNMVAEQLRDALEAHPALTNAEIEKPIEKQEYRLFLQHEKVAKLGVDPSELARTLRAYVEGQILYQINKGEEEVDVRIVGIDSYKYQIADILELRAANKRSYLVPFKNLVEVQKRKKPANIERINYKRVGKIYADFQADTNVTPLEIAEDFEDRVFPELIKSSPTTVLRFRGEVEDSRESQSDFGFSIKFVMGLIYILLVLLFGSLSIPILIASIVPFGLVGVIFAFWAHGMTQYGFFAVIGTLGMIGVVVNDAIIMVSKLEENGNHEDIAKIAATRLRPIIVTTLTTAAGLFPTAYGIAGYDSMLAEMMLAMGWGLVFATSITLVFLPCLYSGYQQLINFFKKETTNVG